MTTKKIAQPQIDKSAEIMQSWNLLFKWLFILSVVISGVTYALSPEAGKYQPDALIWTLMVIGIIVGIFYFDSDDVVNIGLRYFILGTVVRTLEKLYFVGTYITNFLIGVLLFLGPVVLTIVVVFFVKKYFLNK
jgi:hypothetical protein